MDKVGRVGKGPCEQDKDREKIADIGTCKQEQRHWQGKQGKRQRQGQGIRYRYW